MPSPFLHLVLAMPGAGLVERRPGDGTLQGAFLLGSVAADARLLTGQPRATTHFWTTENDISGVFKLLAAHPHLAPSAALPPAVRAYAAGYLSHLVADEEWTLLVYRPYFGRSSPYRGRAEGLALQQALHAHLERGLAPAADGALDALAQGLTADLIETLEAALPLWPAGTLARWRQALEAAAAHYVRPADLARFRECAAAACTRAVAEYLSGRLPSPPPGTQPPDGAGG